jgi:hypothetical protein
MHIGTRLSRIFAVVSGALALSAVLAGLAGASASQAAPLAPPAGAAAKAIASVSLGSDGRGPIVSYRNGKCVQTKSGSARTGTVVVLEPCNGSTAQIWWWANGTVYFTGHTGGLRPCLAPAAKKAVNGTKVVIGSCQSWAVGGNGELWDHQANKCLNDPGGKSANGTQLVLWTCNGSANQEWLRAPVPFYDSDNSRLCMDDQGDRTANGTAIVVWSCSNGAAQNVAMYPATTVDGDYVNTLRVTGKCMAASGGGTANGTKIVLYACNGSGAEKWRIVYNYQSGPATTYVLWDFENPQSGRCLLDPGESTKAGTQLRLGPCDSSATSNADWSQYG